MVVTVVGHTVNTDDFIEITPVISGKYYEEARTEFTIKMRENNEILVFKNHPINDLKIQTINMEIMRNKIISIWSNYSNMLMDFKVK